MMRFYYPSLLSWMLYGFVLIIAVALLSLVWIKLFKLKITNAVYWILVAAILVLPWTEELWIAYRFGQLCNKDAGVLVNTIVEVEGFYDDTRTTRAGPPSPQAIESFDRSGYRFYEMKGDGKVIRIENIAGQWETIVLDRPTARYDYKRTQSHTPVAYKIRKTEYVVSDRQTGELLARETVYVRDPYWFFIALDRPVLVCPEPNEKRTRSAGPVYRVALIAAFRR